MSVAVEQRAYFDIPFLQHELAQGKKTPIQEFASVSSFEHVAVIIFSSVPMFTCEGVWQHRFLW